MVQEKEAGLEERRDIVGEIALYGRYKGLPKSRWKGQNRLFLRGWLEAEETYLDAAFYVYKGKISQNSLACSQGNWSGNYADLRLFYEHR